MFHAIRHVHRPLLLAAVALSGVLVVAAHARPQSQPSRFTAQLTSAEANSHWEWCNEEAIKTAPAVLWSRIESSVSAHKDVPSSFWTNGTYRADIARIVCYESTYNYHAENGPSFGWFQMNQPLIESEGVSWNEYWSGSRSDAPGWYQCTAGERYIHGRYRNPAIAWLHERDYGWY